MLVPPVTARLVHAAQRRVSVLLQSTHRLISFLKKRKRNGLAQAVANLVTELTLVGLVSLLLVVLQDAISSICGECCGPPSAPEIGWRPPSHCAICCAHCRSVPALLCICPCPPLLPVPYSVGSTEAWTLIKWVGGQPRWMVSLAESAALCVRPRVGSLCRSSARCHPRCSPE
jgi:hypothetical protein